MPQACQLERISLPCLPSPIRLLLFLREVSEVRGLSKIDAQSALRSNVCEGEVEYIAGLGYLGGLHRGAGKILLLVIKSSGTDILIDRQGPVVSAGNGIQRVCADGNDGVAKS